MRENIMGKKLRPPIPKFKTPIIETHCHLDYLNSDDLPNQLKKTYDHINMGLYIVPKQNGVISKADKIIIHD